MTLPANYDAWRLAGPEEPHTIGTEDGQPCNRIHEPDEDASRGYKPKPCKGVMRYGEMSEFTFCDTCWEIAE